MGISEKCGDKNSIDAYPVTLGPRRVSVIEHQPIGRDVRCVPGGLHSVYARGEQIEFQKFITHQVVLSIISIYRKFMHKGVSTHSTSPQSLISVQERQVTFISRRRVLEELGNIVGSDPAVTRRVGGIAQASCNLTHGPDSDNTLFVNEQSGIITYGCFNQLALMARLV